MYTGLALTITFLIGVAPAPPNSAAIEEAERLFAYGADHAREKQALEILERALSIESSDYQLLWRTARSFYYTADGAIAKDKLKYLQRGIEIGQRAVSENPNGVEGHFWLGANWGGYCNEKGGITAFRNVKKVRAEMETVLRLNPAFEEGTAYMALGEIDRQLPKLFGGSLDRATSYLEQGLKTAPASVEIKYSLAQAYLEGNLKDRARRELQESLKLPLSATRTNESRRAQEKARRLLDKLSITDGAK